MKYPVLILSASIALLAAAPPPPPPVPSPAATPAATAPAAAAPATAAPTSAPTPVHDLNSLFGAPPKPGASGAPAATPSPPPDDRKGLDGVWELEIQRGDQTEYEHFNLKQTGTALTGAYMTQDKKQYPLAGSIDGRAVRLVVSLADGSTLVLEGRVDGTTDMLGMLTNAKERIPFTAAWRPKEKWSDNLNASPGGLGSPANGPPGGSGPPK